MKIILVVELMCGVFGFPADPVKSEWFASENGGVWCQGHHQLDEVGGELMCGAREHRAILAQALHRRCLDSAAHVSL